MRRRSDRPPSGRSTELQDLGEVLVAAPGEGEDVDPAGLAGVDEKPGERVGGLERWKDPLETRQSAEGVECLAVGDGLVADALVVAQERELRAGSRVVEAGGHRVGLEDLPLLVLEDRRQRPMQDAARSCRERSTVAARLEPLAARLDADDLHIRI